MASSRMSLVVCAAACAAAATGALWLAGAGPAGAADGRIAREVREECRELLREHGFKDIDLDNMRVREEGTTVVVDVDAERRGDDRQLRCIYDAKEKRARLAD